MDTCALCKSSETDDVNFGELLKNDSMAVHTFCLYLTSNLCQRGEDDEGFMGFMPEDIKQEAKRVSRLTCCYCSKKYANIGCCERKCRNTFHMICGLRNGVDNQFVGTFKSFCYTHRRKVNYQPVGDEQCLICYDALIPKAQRYNVALKWLRAPCCQNGWFHKECLQAFAKNAGYFFKCPLCNDTKTFRAKLPYKGIFIPNRDAAWELEPNAFAELLERPDSCSAEVCKCSKGRKNNSDRDPLIFCNTCGSIAIHKFCRTSKVRGNTFTCDECIQYNDSGNKSLHTIEANEEEQDVMVDVCNSDSETEPNIRGNTDDNLEDENETGGKCQQIESKSPSTVQVFDYPSDEEEIVPKRINRSQRIESESSTITILDSSIDEDVPVKKSKTADAKLHRLYDDSSDESSDEIVPCVKNKIIRERKIFDNSDDEDSPDDLDIIFNPSKRDSFQNRKDSLKMVSINETNCEKEYKSDASDAAPSLQSNVNLKTTISYDEFVSENHEEENPLDISCIARRTRRKSTFLSSEESATEKHEEENPLDISCIARRTRRKSTVCSSQSSIDSSSKKCKNNDKEPIIHQWFETLPLTTNANSFGDAKQPFHISSIGKRMKKHKTTRLEETPTSSENSSACSALIDSSSSSSSSSGATSFHSLNSSVFHTPYVSGNESSSSGSSWDWFSHVRREDEQTSSKRRKYLLSADDELIRFPDNNSEKKRPPAVRSPLPVRQSDKDHYLMPKFTRVDGKLKRVNSSLSQNLTTNFSRSYDMLLGGPSENRIRMRSKYNHKCL